MRYAMIMAGGSGTRLWPMSRARMPKQLLPLIKGQSLLQVAIDRLEGLVPTEQIYICAGQMHRETILERVTGMAPQRYLGEPVGRDTLNAVGFAAAVIAKSDPDAVIAVFTADHIIEPKSQFQMIVKRGFTLTETRPNTLVTFGIKPTHAATGYGYLQLGRTAPDFEGCGASPASGPICHVDKFKEKPDAVTAQEYFDAGPNHYLWNSGMFVWPAQTLLNCIQRYEPKTYQGLKRIAEAWGGPDENRTLEDVYPTLRKTSVDYAVMEPASRDADFTVVAAPMPLTWLDVGNWTALAATCEKDEHDNALATDRCVLLDSSQTLVASSDREHLIATIGCEKLLIVHTPDATLVCRADRAEDIKTLHKIIGCRFGDNLL